VGLNQTSAVITASVGESLALFAALDVTAAAGNCCEGGEASVDALNTFSFFIDPLRSDVSYTSLSGSPYLTPAQTAVPEPSSLIYALTSCAALLLQRRRRERRTRR
jgi:hypothetical protein